MLFFFFSLIPYEDETQLNIMFLQPAEGPVF